MIFLENLLYLMVCYISLNGSLQFCWGFLALFLGQWGWQSRMFKLLFDCRCVNSNSATAIPNLFWQMFLTLRGTLFWHRRLTLMGPQISILAKGGNHYPLFMCRAMRRHFPCQIRRRGIRGKNQFFAFQRCL